jgi:hypothetical protein
MLRHAATRSRAVPVAVAKIGPSVRSPIRGVERDDQAGGERGGGALIALAAIAERSVGIVD